ncbi:hypothetical protein [Paenibacillus sp. FSL L8-0709]|uniref:hypothetical protein n=1 Tax=Paenibacillus sp. FSL L8-0709 TaxID=2975312 RepID=UPI0030FA21DB
MENNEGKWVVSTSPEFFNSGDYYESKEEAIAFGLIEYAAYETVKKFHVGQVESVGLGVCVNTDSILEHINQSMCDEVGEAADDYLLYTKQEHDAELEEELSNVIIKWIEKHSYQPTFFKVINIESVDI